MFTFNDYQREKFQYQLDGEILLMERKHACLFYEPGKGKTYPAISALLQVAPKGKILILSTADSVNNMWNSDIVPQKILPTGTVIMSFTSAIQDKTKAQLLKVSWDVIIVDECHKIKSNTSQISKLVFTLTKKVKYAWGLTGTPRGNTDIDIFCQFHNLHVSDWGDVSYTRFIDTCCDVEQSWGRGGAAFKKVIGINARYKAGWERNVAMFSQRICYEEDEMPPLNIHVCKLDYTKTQQYKDTEKGIFRINDTESTMTKLAAISKMHQAANGFLYYSEDCGETRNVDVFAHNDKLDWIANFDCPNAVVVYRHTADLEALQQTLTDWTESIDAFKSGKYKYLLLQCSRCESFNLQMCNAVIFYTLDYSYIKFKQMLHRVWRIGQEADTHIYILLFKGTIEEQIWKAVNSKKKLADLFMMAKEAI